MGRIFNEVWRRYRDFFYVKNMHGYAWKLCASSTPPWCRTRAPLTLTTCSEMVSELSTSHSYIEGGDYDMPKPADCLARAKLELDYAAGRYRIAKIYRGQNEEELYRSPLTEVGVDAHEATTY